LHFSIAAARAAVIDWVSNTIEMFQGKAYQPVADLLKII
jgi:hypothetical protein